MIELLVGITAGILGIGGMFYQFLFKSDGLTYPMILFLGISVSIWAVYGLVLENTLISTVNFILVALLALIAMRKRLEI